MLSCNRRVNPMAASGAKGVSGLNDKTLRRENDGLMEYPRGSWRKVCQSL